METWLIAAASLSTLVSLGAAVAGYLTRARHPRRLRQRGLDVELDPDRVVHLDVQIDDADYAELKEAIQRKGRVVGETVRAAPRAG